MNIRKKIFQLIKLLTSKSYKSHVATSLDRGIFASELLQTDLISQSIGHVTKVNCKINIKIIIIFCTLAVCVDCLYAQLMQSGRNVSG